MLQRLARQAEAAKQLTEAVKVSPGYFPARVKLAEALFEAGDLDRSAAMFTELIREPLAEPASEFGLGRVAAARGRHEEAVTHLQRAITLFPEFGAAHYALARSYRALGRRTRRSRRSNGTRSMVRAGPDSIIRCSPRSRNYERTDAPNFNEE